MKPTQCKRKYIYDHIGKWSKSVLIMRGVCEKNWKLDYNLNEIYLLQ